MNVALVNFAPRVSTKNYPGFNHGLGHLSSVAKRRGHTTQLFTIDRKNCGVTNRIVDFSPHIVLVYLTANQFPLFSHYLSTRWQFLNAPLFVGGPHATCCGEDLLTLRGVTGVCIGEGEEALRLILARLEKSEPFFEIPNLWTEKDGAICRTQTGQFTEDLDTLPFPDRSIFPYERLMGTRAMNILGFEFFSTRGCMHNCTYCINPHLKRLNGIKTSIRRRSPKNLIEEIVQVTRHYEYNGVIGFHDDIFTMDYAWLQEFAEEYKARVGMPFWCNTHFNNLGAKTAKTLRSAGCFRVQMGVECGNEYQRKSVLGKNISNRRIMETTALVKKHHLKIVTNFMIGIPGETEENVLESIDLCQKISPDWILLSTYCPYPGTALFHDLVDGKKLEAKFYEKLETDTYYAPHGPWVPTSLSNARHRYYFENFVRLSKGKATI